CEQGEHRWIDVPAEGGDEPESPAPTLTLTASAGDDHGGGGGGGGGDEPVSNEGAEPAGDQANGSGGAETATAAEVRQAQDDANGARTFGIIGFSVGAAALAIALGAFVKANRSTTGG